MTRVGVVLGAGGIVGAAYHSGVLTALAEAGFDARDADVVVGTSAGAGVAATQWTQRGAKQRQRQHSLRHEHG